MFWFNSLSKCSFDWQEKELYYEVLWLTLTCLYMVYVFTFTPPLFAAAIQVVTRGNSRTTHKPNEWKLGHCETGSYMAMSSMGWESFLVNIQPPCLLNSFKLWFDFPGWYLISYRRKNRPDGLATELERWAGIIVSKPNLWVQHFLRRFFRYEKCTN